MGIQLLHAYGDDDTKSEVLIIVGRSLVDLASEVSKGWFMEYWPQILNLSKVKDAVISPIHCTTYL